MVFSRSEEVSIAETVVFYVVVFLAFLSHFILGVFWFKKRKHQPLKTRGEGPILALIFYSLRNLLEGLTGRYVDNGPAFGYTILPKIIHCYTSNIGNYPLLVSVVIVKLWMHVRISIKIHLYKLRYRIAHHQVRVTPITQRHIRTLQWASSRRVYLLGVILSVLLLASIVSITMGVDDSIGIECQQWDATYITRQTVWVIFFVIASIIFLQIVITRIMEIFILKRPWDKTDRIATNLSQEHGIKDDATPLNLERTEEITTITNQSNHNHNYNHNHHNNNNENENENVNTIPNQNLRREEDQSVKHKGFKATIQNRWKLWRLIDPFYLDLEYFWFYSALCILLLYVYLLMAFRQFRTSVVYGAILFLIRLNLLLALVAFPTIITAIWDKKSYSVWKKIGYGEDTTSGKLKPSVQRNVIENALHEPDFHDAFMAHLKREQCFENLLFWDKVQQLKHLPSGSSRQRHLARDIYRNYLAPDSMWHINTNESNCEYVRTQLSIPELDSSVQESFYSGSSRVPPSPRITRETLQSTEQTPPLNEHETEDQNQEQSQEQEQGSVNTEAVDNGITVSVAESTPTGHVHSEPTLSQTRDRSRSNFTSFRKLSSLLMRPFQRSQHQQHGRRNNRRNRQRQRDVSTSTSSEELRQVDIPAVYKPLENDAVVLMSDSFVRFLQSEQYESLQRKRRLEFKELV